MSQRSNAHMYVCDRDDSRKTSSIVTKLIHMNLNYNWTKEFEDERFVTDLRSRSKRSNVQNIDECS